MVVRGEVLPELVRLTAMTANRYVRFCFEGYRRPFPTRRLRINEVVERYVALLSAALCVLVCNVLCRHKVNTTPESVLMYAFGL